MPVIFDEAVEHLIQAEGGFVNNPNDPGQATKYGITLKTLRAFKKNDNLDAKDVEFMNLDVARAIYYANYYQPLGLVDCENRWACIMLLDQAANRGLTAVKDDLHHMLGFKLNPSYPTVCSILNFYQDQFDKLPMLNITFAIDFLIRAQEEYIRIAKANPRLQVFLNGWLARTHRLFYLIKT